MINKLFKFKGFLFYFSIHKQLIVIILDDAQPVYCAKLVNLWIHGII